MGYYGGYCHGSTIRAMPSRGGYDKLVNNLSNTTANHFRSLCWRVEGFPEL